MTTAKKFVFTIAADYEGQSELKQLQSDLKVIGQIEAFEQIRKDWEATNKKFVEAKARVRELRAAMKEAGNDSMAGAFKKANAEVAKLSTTLTKQKTQLEASRTLLQQSGIAVSDLATSYKQLKTATGNQGQVIAAQMKLGVRSVKAVKTEIDGLKRAYTTLKTSGVVSAKELAKAHDQLQTKVAALKQETNGWAQQLGRIQQGWAGLLATAGAVTAASRGISFFAGFDDSMRDVQAFLDAGADDMERLTQLAKDLGSSTRFSAAEVGKGMAELAQSGMDVEEMFAALPHVTDLAAASNMSFKESADLVTDTLKQFQLETNDIGKVTDIIVKGYTSAGHSSQQLGEALSYVGPIAKSMGYSIEETVAAINALADAGYKGQRGGTALRGGFVRLINPVREAQEVLDKYNIQIYDSEGNIRNFADIIEDLGNAALTQSELFTLFGQEAGPGMAALLGQGADAIRGFNKELENAGGTAAKIASTKEGGIGGALRNLSSALQDIVIQMGDSIEPVEQALADGLTAIFQALAGLPQPVLAVAAAFATGVTAMAAWHLGIKHIFSAIKLGTADVVGLTARLPLLAIGFKLVTRSILPLYAAFETGFAIGEWLNQFDIVQKAGIALSAALTKGFLKIKQGWAWVSGGDTEAVQREIDEADKIYAEMFANVGKAAEQAADRVNASQGKIAKGAEDSAAKQQKANEAALESMRKEYQEYAREVQRLQDEIVGRQQSHADQIRAIQREGMTDLQAYDDLKKEAEEYAVAARKAAEAGDYSGFLELMDQAKSKVASLSKEVKSGDTVLVSQAKSIEERTTLLNGYQNEIISVLEKQKDAAAESMEALTEKSGFQDLSKGMEEAERKWLDNWDNMRSTAVKDIDAVEDRLLAIKDKEVTVWINEKVSSGSSSSTRGYKNGGMIQALRTGGTVWRNILAGGRLGGFGGGDTVPLMGEPGEVMINKWASKAAGYKAALAFNAQRWDVVVSELFKRFKINGFQHGGAIASSFSLPKIPAIAPQHLATGGAVAAAGSGGTVEVYLNFPGNQTVGPFHADRATARRLDRVKNNMSMGSS